MAKIKITGINGVMRNVNSLVRDSTAAARRGARAWGENTMTYSKAFVPVEFGNLRGSGRVRNIDSRDQVVIELSYGEGIAGEYAIPVHERPARHKVGGDKYLETPALQRADQFKRDVADRVKSETGI